MSKKYIFIKFLEPAPCDFLLDENTLFDTASCQLISNILQLNQEQELRFVIAKDLELQSALTSSLPQAGVHGLLWSGAHWPEASSFLLFDDRIHSIFIFYKTGERPPAILERPREAIARKWELYNWHIYQMPGFQLLKNNLFVIRALSSHELETDKQFTALWRAFKNGLSFPWQVGAVNLQGKNSYKNGSSPYRPLTGLQHSSQAHLSSLIKFILPGFEGSLLIASPDNFDYLWPAVFLPLRLTLWPGTVVQQAYLKTSGLMFSFPAEELSRTISLFMTDLRRLLVSSTVSQTDLFYGNLEGEFADYWQKEKLRLEELTANTLEFNDRKALAAARFLSNSKVFAQDKVHQAFLHLALAQTAATLLKKKNKPEFVQLIHQTLRELYLDFYTYRQIAALVRDEMQDKNEIKSTKTNDVIDAAVGEFNFTADSNKKRRQRLVEILLNGNEENADSFIPPEAHIPVTEAVVDTQMVERLGQYCISILVHQLSKNEEKRALLLLRMWLEVFYFLQQTAPRLRSGGRIAVALNTGTNTPGNNEWRRVAESFLQNGLRTSQLRLMDVVLEDSGSARTFLFFEKQ